MGVTFSEGRGLPKEFTRGSGYEGFHRFGDDYQDGAAKIARAVLPWDLLTGLFVTKPQAERAAEVAIAQAQAGSIAYTQQARSENLQSILKYGAMAVGALALVLVFTRRRSSVGGYRKSRRSRRSRRN